MIIPRDKPTFSLKPTYVGCNEGETRFDQWVHLVSDVQSKASTPIKINQDANIFVLELSSQTEANGNVKTLEEVVYPGGGTTGLSRVPRGQGACFRPRAESTRSCGDIWTCRDIHLSLCPSASRVGASLKFSAGREVCAYSLLGRSSFYGGDGSLGLRPVIWPDLIIMSDNGEDLSCVNVNKIENCCN
jgi:hypothetical protein